MFSQPPDEEPNCSKTLKNNPRSRRQKKLRRKNRLKAIKKDQIATKRKTRTPVTSVPTTMSSWAENFTNAATWQLKHQVAFWKSKAMALEHENRILHMTIRENCTGDRAFQNSSDAFDFPASSATSDDESDLDDDMDKEFEVSEEYIQFLKDNQAYRDSAKQERERLKNLNDVEQQNIAEMEAGPSENTEDPKEVLKRLYGDRWERISALEMSLQSQFISISDRDKPIYWPNIPFNFNFG